MDRYAKLLISLSISVILIAAVGLGAIVTAPPPTIERDLVLFGPAKDGLTAAGFTPSGRATVYLFEGILGVDKLVIKVQGLPPGVPLAVFLTQKNAPDFGAVQYIATGVPDKQGKFSRELFLVVEEAFAFTRDEITKGINTDPTKTVDLNFIVLWFANQGDDNAFLDLPGPTLIFDGDRQSGVAVLRTTVALP